MKFDSFKIGEKYETAKIKLTKEDILQFGRQYDPQYFHVDEQAAKASPYGSLIASGFQTLAIIWAEWIKLDVLGHDCLGGISANIKWTAPVSPGDELLAIIIVADKKKTSTGDRGLITLEINIHNQKNE